MFGFNTLNCSQFCVSNIMFLMAIVTVAALLMKGSSNYINSLTTRNTPTPTTNFKTKSTKTKDNNQPIKPKNKKNTICRIEKRPTGVSNNDSLRKPTSSNHNANTNSDTKNAPTTQHATTNTETNS